MNTDHLLLVFIDILATHLQSLERLCIPENRKEKNAMTVSELIRLITTVVNALPPDLRIHVLRDLVIAALALIVPSTRETQFSDIFPLNNTEYYTNIVSVNIAREIFSLSEGNDVQGGKITLIPKFEGVHSIVVPYGENKQVGIHKCFWCESIFMSDSGDPPYCTQCHRRTWRTGERRNKAQ